MYRSRNRPKSSRCPTWNGDEPTTQGALTVTTENKPARPAEAEINARFARVDGAMGAAGHVITDPVVRELLRKQAAGEISGDEARAHMAARRSAERDSRSSSRSLNRPSSGEKAVVP
jgi:hypothetical protein